jgi:hypothetical protein
MEAGFDIKMIISFVRLDRSISVVLTVLTTQAIYTLLLWQFQQ